MKLSGIHLIDNTTVSALSSLMYSCHVPVQPSAIVKWWSTKWTAENKTLMFDWMILQSHFGVKPHSTFITDEWKCHSISMIHIHMLLMLLHIRKWKLAGITCKWGALCGSGIHWLFQPKHWHSSRVGRRNHIVWNFFINLGGGSMMPPHFWKQRDVHCISLVSVLLGKIKCALCNVQRLVVSRNFFTPTM